MKGNPNEHVNGSKETTVKDNVIPTVKTREECER